MRQLQVFFFVFNIFTLLAVGLYGSMHSEPLMAWVGYIMAFFSFIIGMMLDGKKLHMKHDEMIAAEKKALIQIRNCQTWVTI